MPTTLKELKSFIEDKNESVEVESTEEVVSEVAPPGDNVERFLKDAQPTFKKRYGKNWERVLYATAWKKFAKGEDIEVFDALDTLTEQDLHEISQVAVVVKKHRGEIQQNRLKHQRELEKAKEQDTEHKLISKKRKDRERLAKTAQKAGQTKHKSSSSANSNKNEEVISSDEMNTDESTLVFEDSAFMTDEKFNTLLRHGLIKISQLPILRLAFKKLDENQSPSLIERQLVYGIMDKLIGYILNDPVVYNRVDRQVLRDRK